MINIKELKKSEPFLFIDEFNQILANLKNYFKLQKELIVDVEIVTKSKIKKLNKEYRGKDYVTDILSFDFGDKAIYESLPILHLGELIICHDKVVEQAEEFNHSLKREYCYLFTHGLVHLMGYDHEIEEERIAMNKMVDDIFNPLNITREN